MIGAMSTSPENTIQKHAFWLVCTSFKPQTHPLIPSRQAFNAAQAVTLSPLYFLSPAILGRAALYTAGVVGALSYVGATAKYVRQLKPQEFFLILDE